MIRSDIQLVAFDLDGTLLDSSCRVRKDTHQAIKHLQKQGVLVTFITGRTFCAAAPYAVECEIMAPMGLVHGALVRDMRGLVVQHRAIPAVGVQEAVEVAFELGCVPMIIGDDLNGNLTICEDHRNDEIVRFILENDAKSNQVLPHEIVYKERHQLNLKALTIYVIGNKDVIHDYLSRIQSQKIQLYQSGCYPLHTTGGDKAYRDQFAVAMLSPMGADKKTAMEVISDNLGISLKKVLAFGDWHNDIPMLKAAGHAVLMGNAPAGLADKIGHPHLIRTGSHDSTGVVDALERLNLLD